MAAILRQQAYRQLIEVDMKPIRVVEFDGKTFVDKEVGCTYMRMHKTADTELETQEEIGCVSWYLWNPVGWQLLDEREIKDFLENKFKEYICQPQF